MNWQYILSLFLLVFGFGFVIFWHELGHFLAAKLVGIRVEQFAVGFGQALVAWRKGIGFRVGTTTKEYNRRIHAYVETAEAQQLKLKDQLEPTGDQVDQAAFALGLGETEYRLNWIPLGGYVKMLGQDDLNPNSRSDDPRSYNAKSIPARMLVVSAGVVMNIILAAILFMILFRTGFTAAAPIVGGVQPGSPAQRAGVLPGDRLLTYDGHLIHDFTKLQLNTALSENGTAVPLEVERTGPDGKPQVVKMEIVPRRADATSKQFVQIGIVPPFKLEGQELPKNAHEREALLASMPQSLPDATAVLPGETVVKVNGESIERTDVINGESLKRTDLAKFDRIMQASGGKPLVLTVRAIDGKEREERVRPRFIEPFGARSVHFAGLAPRPVVSQIVKGSPAEGKLNPGDIVLAASVGAAADEKAFPNIDEFRELLGDAGNKGQTVSLTVLRGKETVVVPGLTPNVKLQNEKRSRGLNIGLEYDFAHADLAGAIPGTPAAEAQIPRGATILSINGQKVESFHDIFHLLAAAKPGAVRIEYSTPSSEVKTKDLALSPEQYASVAGNRYMLPLQSLAEMKETRKTSSLLTAAGWGVTETRDFILQFYVTLRRMVGGDVDPSNLMGPVGIFHAGSQFAYRGTDWLIWFLAMISANLAVVNFLPIPIVDGGLFTFLIMEKIKGRPVSARTQSIAQVVGLVLLLGVFLFVTFNDIQRLF